ncbi:MULTISPECIES: hypothetical protein [unclassified Streptomyces]|uniref:hypothetical protein n=1 Tax=unclassified Streptomyces TaxID=2593676 RepID=UPI003D722E7F
MTQTMTATRADAPFDEELQTRSDRPVPGDVQQQLASRIWNGAPVILTEGGSRVAIRTDEESAAYVGVDIVCGERAAAPESGHAARAVVELSRALGGVTMRALLGAEFSPDPRGAVTVFEIPFGESAGLGAVTGCGSELGPPLVAGLPSDFAAAALDGLAGDTGVAALPAGLLRVGRAGFDEVGSSEMAFKLAGRLLRCVVDALLRGRDPYNAVRAAVGAW